VYRCFFAHAREDRYELHRGGDLWRLLVAIMLDKLRDQIKWNTRAKRNVNREQRVGSDDSWQGIELRLLARPPSPLEALAVAEALEEFMRSLEPIEARVLELRLQGFNLEEIAADVKRGVSTVSRTLDRIKQRMQQKQEVQEK